MNDSIVKITDNARAVLALSDELSDVENQILYERERHNASISNFEARKSALQEAILKLGGTPC